MMKHVSILFLIFLTCFWAGCSDELIDTPEDLPKKGIVVKLTTGQLDTKTHLYSQASLHHVEKVYAILYYCGEMTETETDIDPDSTTVVTSQLLKKDGTPWNPSLDNTYGQGQPQTETFELTLPEDQISMVPGKYMILCVGLDDASGETYGLTFDETADTESGKKPTFAQKGAKLSEAQAIFAGTAEEIPSTYLKDSIGTETDNKQDGDLIAYGQPDIAHSELFAGWQAFDFMPDDLNVVAVEMRRRVAGVLCYLSEIPYKLNVGPTPYRVTKVRLNLYTGQNGQIGLMRQLPMEGKPSPNDFGKPIEGKPICQTLCEFNLMDFTPQKTNGGDLLYQIPTQHLKGRKQLENTILMGAYVLPIQAGTEATLQVELLGYEYDDSSTDSDHIVNDKGPGNAEPTVIKRFPAIYDGLETPENYDLLPNMIYHIGHKLDNDNTEGDYPESLAGTKVTIEAEPWHEMDIPVEFPSVPIVPLMSLRNEDDNKYKTESYIFDCIGSIGKDYLEISSSVLYSDWVLKAVLPGGSLDKTPWIQFWDEESNNYVTELTGSGSPKIYIRMDDYASVEDSRNNQKTRTITLLLTAKDETGATVSDASYQLNVSQYNALIVKMEKDEDGYRGFSHFDFGTQRNLVTGEEIHGTATTLGWGYWSSFPITPKWNDGQHNYNYLAEHWPGSFSGSAVQRCGLGEYGAILDVDKKESPFWYLSARDEMLFLFENYHRDESAHIKKNQYYWTCNEWGRTKVATACKFDLSTNAKERWKTREKTDTYYARQACHAQ